MNTHCAKFVSGVLTYAPSIIITKRDDTIHRPPYIFPELRNDNVLMCNLENLFDRT